MYGPLNVKFSYIAFACRGI